MSLRKEIENWDGDTVTDIVSIYEKHHKKEKFINEIVLLLSERKLQMEASWLLKKYVETRNAIDSDFAFVIYSKILSFDGWESKLHILQAMPFLPIPSTEKDTVEKFLRICLTDKNKFVRAWAFGGFYLLADQFPEYRDEARQFIDGALINESASIKARIRNVIKTGFLSSERKNRR